MLHILELWWANILTFGPQLIRKFNRGVLWWPIPSEKKKQFMGYVETFFNIPLNTKIVSTKHLSLKHQYLPMLEMIRKKTVKHSYVITYWLFLSFLQAYWVRLESFTGYVWPLRCSVPMYINNFSHPFCSSHNLAKCWVRPGKKPGCRYLMSIKKLEPFFSHSSSKMFRHPPKQNCNKENLK